jgi:hypothetical protein
MSSPKRRIETDVMKLMMSDYEVTLVNDNMQEFYVIFKGPQESKNNTISYCPLMHACLNSRLVTDGKCPQLRLLKASGKSMSNYPTSIRTNRHQSDLSTESSIPISTNCQCCSEPQGSINGLCSINRG